MSTKDTLTKPLWSFVVRHGDGPAVQPNARTICWVRTGANRATAEAAAKRDASKRSGIPIDELTATGQPDNYAATVADALERDAAKTTKLTPAQRRILADVCERKEVIYNGRARKPIEALEKAGLVVVHWGVQAYKYRITVRPK